MIVVGAAGISGRILAVDAVDSSRLEGYLYGIGRPDWQKKLPFLSANDRSRWITIRSLVEHGTYEIDEIIKEPNWDSIDVVKHDEQGRAAPEPGQGHFYSSKPPLLSTQIAPAGNPFRASADTNAWLVYANGLRNPFRFQVDAGAQTLVIADVGQNVYEELDLILQDVVFAGPRVDITEKVIRALNGPGK